MSLIPKKTIVNFLLLFLSLFIVFVSMELFIRIIYFKPEIPDRITGSTRLSSFVLRRLFYESSFSMGDQGFRLALHRDVHRGISRGLVHWNSIDPDLGWVAGQFDEKNPITPYNIVDLPEKPTILFYGNSFVCGLTDISHKIPQLLEGKLQNVSVLNLGVCGYGYDQCFLRMEKTINYFNEPHILMGIFLDDINRCLLRIYGVPKPYFTLIGDSLILNGVPVSKDPKTWLEMYPANFNTSFAVLFMKGLIRRSLRTPLILYNVSSDLYMAETRKSRKKAEQLFRHLIYETVEECNKKSLKLTFVVFPYSHDVSPELHSWQYILVTDMMNQQNLDYIDCSKAYQQYHKANPQKRPHNLLVLLNHPDAELNEIIAQQIAEHLHDTYDYNIKK